MNTIKKWYANVERIKFALSITGAAVCSILESHVVVLIFIIPSYTSSRDSIIFLFGTCIGAIFNFIVSDSIGRQQALLYIVLLTNIILILLSLDYYHSYYILQFLCGGCIGLIESILPVFIVGMYILIIHNK